MENIIFAMEAYDGNVVNVMYRFEKLLLSKLCDAKQATIHVYCEKEVSYSIKYTFMMLRHFDHNRNTYLGFHVEFLEKIKDREHIELYWDDDKNFCFDLINC